MRLTEHGSARFAEVDDLIEAEMIGTAGIVMGYKRAPNKAVFPIQYTSDQHLFTVAPNRTGKGTCAIIPALMRYRGGIFVIDPKGENAIITAGWRRVLGQNVQILDPWGIALSAINKNPVRDPFDSAGFNPLDMLHPDSPDLIDDARMIADALVTETGGDSHWSTEAKSLLTGFIIHVVTSPVEEGNRHLPRVRDILNLSPRDMGGILLEMQRNGVTGAKTSANQMAQKGERELKTIISTAVANTHFLDSEAVRSALKETTFDFADLKNEDSPLTVYMVLPAERLQTHGRWLRLLVSMALTSITRTKGKPKHSALFILDEFAALGTLTAITTAFGLMAGFGMRIWAILQDMSQLRDLYPKRWQTFIANSGVVQVFGVSDLESAQYFSQMMGRETLEKISKLTQSKRDGGWLTPGDPEYRGMTDSSFARDLMTPDEIMQMGENNQLLLFSKMPPVYGLKLPYYRNASFFGKGRYKNISLFDQHPDQPPPPPNPLKWDEIESPGLSWGWLPALLWKHTKRAAIIIALICSYGLYETGGRLPVKYYQETVLHWDVRRKMQDANAVQCAIMDWVYSRYPPQVAKGLMLSRSVVEDRGIHPPYRGDRGDIVIPQPRTTSQIGTIYTPVEWGETNAHGIDFASSELIKTDMRPVVIPCK